MPSLNNILIANRGEIACRIIRTAKSMGIQTTAVYSEADANAPHVIMADDAFLLGPAPVSDSYLNMERILTAIKVTKADAVHPGYGFLSENAAFAKTCADNGTIFIGPGIEAIDIMGDKAKSKRRMIEAGVPCIPGYQGEDQSDDILIAKSADIGFPLMVKAAAGGGGKGMRFVETADALLAAITLARSEAENAFGSDELILEKAVLNPRHVEIQIFADSHGNTIHLGERDCSVQRRHQKVLEESPCPVMTQELRERIGAAAIKAAQDVDYVGAGTVEFLLDSKNNFYFLEMNTRLQVEHPVTEMVTGLDLVALQIRVAKGETLDIRQEDVTLNGHSIEARLYAEDSAQDFLPATGSIDLWAPANADGIRIDAGIQTSSEISPYYDPMIAKVIAHGATREEARKRLVNALKETALMGIVSNKKFLLDALEKPLFTQGSATTAFIADTFSQDEFSRPALTPTVAIITAVLLHESARTKAITNSTHLPEELINWSSASKITTPYRFTNDDLEKTVTLTPQNITTYQVECCEQKSQVQIVKIDKHIAILAIDNKRTRVHYNIPQHDPTDQTIQLTLDGSDYTLTNLNGVIQTKAKTVGVGDVLAPMHGLLQEVYVKADDQVKKGDKLAVLEAMKMQHELRAEVDGTIEKILFKSGVQVAADCVLMVISEDSE